MTDPLNLDVILHEIQQLTKEADWHRNPLDRIEQRRAALIRQARRQGATLATIAEHAGVSRQRVHAITRQERQTR